MEGDPYTPPSVDDSNDTSFLEIRKSYENRELSIRLTGIAFLLFGCIVFIQGFSFPPTFSNEHEKFHWMVMTIVGLSILLLILCTGIGLWKLNWLARIAALIWCLITLFGFPIGTVIAVYYSFLLLGAKANFVFSAYYRKTVKETPSFRIRLVKSNLRVWLPQIAIFAFIIYFFIFK